MLLHYLEFVHLPEILSTITFFQQNMQGSIRENGQLPSFQMCYGKSDTTNSSVASRSASFLNEPKLEMVSLMKGERIQIMEHIATLSLV